MHSLLRHRAFIDPEHHRRERIVVVGVGALGGRVGLRLAEQGFISPYVEVWDPDTVGPENISCQVYGRKHIGQSKVSALAAHIVDMCGDDVAIDTRYEKVVAETLFDATIVIVAVDSLEARGVVLKAAMNNLHTRLFIDGRLCTDLKQEGRLWVIDPRSGSHVAEYRASLESKVASEPPPAGNCGGTITLNATADVIGGFMVECLVHYLREPDQVRGLEATIHMWPPLVDDRSF